VTTCSPADEGISIEIKHLGWNFQPGSIFPETMISCISEMLKPMFGSAVSCCQCKTTTLAQFNLNCGFCAHQLETEARLRLFTGTFTFTPCQTSHAVTDFYSDIHARPDITSRSDQMPLPAPSPAPPGPLLPLLGLLGLMQESQSPAAPESAWEAGCEGRAGIFLVFLSVLILFYIFILRAPTPDSINLSV
jgi:hypothetical protein